MQFVWDNDFYCAINIVDAIGCFEHEGYFFEDNNYEQIRIIKEGVIEPLMIPTIFNEDNLK